MPRDRAGMAPATSNNAAETRDRQPEPRRGHQAAGFWIDEQPAETAPGGPDPAAGTRSCTTPGTAGSGQLGGLAVAGSGEDRQPAPSGGWLIPDEPPRPAGLELSIEFPGPPRWWGR